MNSDGWMLTTTSDSQRFEPLTDLPMPGTSTSTSSTAPRDEEPRRAALPDLDRHLEREERRGEADREEHRVAREEIPRAIAGMRRRLRHRDRRRIHHHEPEREQQQRAPCERDVEREHRARLARQRMQRRPADAARWR